MYMAIGSPIANQVLITEVSPNSQLNPPAFSPVMSSHVNSKPLESLEDFQKHIKTLAGAEITLTIERNGGEQRSSPREDPPLVRALWASLSPAA